MSEAAVIYGECRFCGQKMNVTGLVGAEATEEQKNKAATSNCWCEAAQNMRMAEEARTRAFEVINSMIQDEEVKASMQTLVPPVCEGHVKKVVIDNGTGTKYKMKLNKSGLIEVTITVTNVTAMS